MIAVSLFVVIIGGTLGTYTMCQRSWHKSSLAMEVAHDANMALSLMTYGYGTNNGLRSATTIIVNTNVLGCWVVASTNPQAATDSDHFMLTNATKNGSFRILFSNAYDGMKWIDYNILASNIVYFPVIGQDNKRVLICNYVKSASATNKSDGVSIQFTVSRGRGMFSVTNTVSTFIKKRM